MRGRTYVPGSQENFDRRRRTGYCPVGKLYLEKEGFHTTVANSGFDALKLMKAERPDLLILDLMLPEIDGIEVCKKIRTVPDTALLPIIMLTAKAEESDTIIGLELGADDYVTKPFSPKALVA
ncbi:MAG TPA: response regulator, partial [Nitrospiraceae bacterium]|nr:response regulator [Nitrospiraceae bacterium]